MAASWPTDQLALFPWYTQAGMVGSGSPVTRSWFQRDCSFLLQTLSECHSFHGHLLLRAWQKRAPLRNTEVKTGLAITPCSWQLFGVYVTRRGDRGMGTNETSTVTRPGVKNCWRESWTLRVTWVVKTVACGHCKAPIIERPRWTVRTTCRWHLQKASHHWKALERQGGADHKGPSVEKA